MHRLHAFGQRHAVAAFAVSHAVHRGVHSQHQCFKISGFDLCQQLAQGSPVGQPVKLKPQRAAFGIGGHQRRHVVQRRAGLV